MPVLHKAVTVVRIFLVTVKPRTILTNLEVIDLMNIGRTLFWFKDGDEQRIVFNDRFFAYGILLNRLLNEHYTGKKIKFININFNSQLTYELYPDIPKESAYFFGGHLQYYGLIDFRQFEKLTEGEQNQTIWQWACIYLQNAAEVLKNSSLLAASKHAFSKGLEIKLNPDYRILDCEIILYGEKVRGSVWVNFKKDGMYSKLTIERNNKVLYEKHIDKTKNGVELFLEMYKKIESDGTRITLKGIKADGGNLPLTIPISKGILVV
jgi:hypothetical protein